MSISKKVTRLLFEVWSPEEIMKETVCNITSIENYENERPTFCGLFDLRMGTIDKKYHCHTCKHRIEDCPGHFGRIELEEPVFYPHYLPNLIKILQIVCYNCRRFLDEDLNRYDEWEKDHPYRLGEKVEYDGFKYICGDVNAVDQLRIEKSKNGGKKDNDNNDDDNDDEEKKDELVVGILPTDVIYWTCLGKVKYRSNAGDPIKQFKTIFSRCKKKARCGECRMEPVKFKRDNFKLTVIDEVGKHSLSARTCQQYFRNLRPYIPEMIGMDPERIHGMICSVLPVGPPCIRPSVYSGYLRADDDLTYNLLDIVKSNEDLKKERARNDTKIAQLREVQTEFREQAEEEKRKLTPAEKRKITAIDKEIVTIRDIENSYYELLQYHVFTLIDNNMSCIPPSTQRSGRALKTLKERLIGKGGRVRKYCLGKRTNFSARTVVDGDPLIDIDEVGIPYEMAMNLTYPERINRYNEQKLREYVWNGPFKYPGANYLIVHTPRGKRKIQLKYNQKVTFLFSFEVPKEYKAKKFECVLNYGDIVERHMIDGDYVAFNRQPSLHRMSIMGHRAKILPFLSFRMNPAVCNPYNS